MRDPGTTSGAELLSQDNFNALLARLSPDRDEAGRRYEGLRARLAFFFAQRQFPDPETLADEVLNRIAAHIQSGKGIGIVEAYAYGVARHLAQEAFRKNLRNSEAENTYSRNILRPKDTHNEDQMRAAMDDCLRMCQEEGRGLLLDYYSSRGEELIERRRKLAASLGISQGALRKRIFRLREDIERCVRARLGNGWGPSDE